MTTVARQQFPLTESLRGIACVGIVVFHIANEIKLTGEPGVLAQLILRMDVGLWVFFVISGFLLYRPFVVASLERSPQPGIRAYLVRRFLRLAPGYWVALTLTALWFDIPNVFEPADAARQYLLIQNYWPDSLNQGLGQAWSICVELAFYLTLPVYAVLVRRLPISVRARPAVELTLLGLLVGSSVLYKYHYLHVGLQYQSVYLPWWLDLIGAGMMLAVIQAHVATHPRERRWIRFVERFPSVLLLAAAASLAILCFGLGFTGQLTQPLDPAQIMERHLINGVAGVLLVAMAVFGQPRQGRTRRLLANRGIRYLGTISYGTFLWQVAGILFTVRSGVLEHIPFESVRAIAAIVLTLAISTAAGSLSWHMIERRAIRLGHRTRSGSTPPATVTVPR
jgi:peptidoglycan/LPS O-acetylase OafA/YrhL